MQTFEKVADQSFSDFCEVTLNHRFYGLEKVRMIQKKDERRKNRVRRGKKTHKLLATLE